MASADIESLPILDKVTAIKDLDDVKLFENMLMGFEDMAMKTNLTNLKIALENMDYYNIRMSSHSLKGAASYLHAERVKTSASLVQLAVDEQKPLNIFKYYPILLKECIVLKRRIRQEACQKAGKPLKDDESDFDIPIAKYFKLIKRSSLDFEVLQIMKPPPFPAVPKFDFKKPGKVECVPDSAESKILQGDTKDQLSSPAKDPSERNSHNDLNCKKEVEIKQNEGGKGEIKIEQDEPRGTSCSCNLL